MELEELEKIIIEKNKKFPQYKERASKELMRAKISYGNGINLVDEINKLSKDNNLSDRYVIPFYLGITKNVDLKKPIEIKQVKEGDSGGLDIDTDLSTEGKPRVKLYLEEKYGKDHISSVGTYSAIGLASGIKSILRKEKVPFAESNLFCSKLDSDLSFEENMDNYKSNFPNLYSIYLKYKGKLDFTPKIMNILQSIGKHAGGVLILDKPIWERIPVVRTQGEIASAYEESSQVQALDELGIIKYDLLGITQLDLIDEALDMAEESGEKFYKIKDDDGRIKIVSKSYILKNASQEIKLKV